MSAGAARAASEGGSSPRPGSIARNAFHLLVGQVLTTALSIALHSVLGRSLGAVEFGVLFLVTSWTSFVSDVTAWGVGALLVTRVARDASLAGPLLGAAIAFRVAATVLVLGPAVLLIRLLGYDASTQGLFAIAIATSVPLAVATLYGWVMRGRERMGRDALVTVAAKALALALVVPVLLAGGGVASILVAQGVAGLGGLWIAEWQRRRLRMPRLRVEWRHVRDIAVLGVPVVVLSLQVGAQAFLDSLLVSKLAPPDVVGWYGAAKTLLGFLVTPAAIIASASFPALSRGAGIPGALVQEIRKVRRPLVWLGALASAGTWLFADVAIGLVYGRRGFGPASAVVQVFGVSLLLVFVDSLLSYVLLAVERSRQLAVGKLLSVVVSVAVAWWAIPWCQARFGNGAIGSAVGFGAGEVFMVVAGVLVMPRGVLGWADAVDLGRGVLAAVATVAALRVVPAMSPVAAIPLSIAVFAAAGAVTGLARPGDLAGLRSALNRRTGNG